MSWNNKWKSDSFGNSISNIFKKRWCFGHVDSPAHAMRLWGRLSCGECQWGCWNAASQGPSWCAKMCRTVAKQMCLQKGPWDSEIQLCWYEKYIYLKNELLFYYSTSTGCLFMQPLPTLKRPFSVPIFENGVLIWVFFFSGPPQSFLPKPTDGTDGTRFHSKKWCHHLGLHPTLFLGRFSKFFQMWIFEATPKQRDRGFRANTIVCQCFWWFCWVSRLLNHHN